MRAISLIQGSDLGETTGMIKTPSSSLVKIVRYGSIGILYRMRNERNRNNTAAVVPACSLDFDLDVPSTQDAEQQYQNGDKNEASHYCSSFSHAYMNDRSKREGFIIALTNAAATRRQLCAVGIASKASRCHDAKLIPLLTMDRWFPPKFRELVVSRQLS